jgi:hypothetical protein
MPKDLVVVCYFPLLDMLKPYSVLVVSGYSRERKAFILLNGA